MKVLHFTVLQSAGGPVWTLGITVRWKKSDHHMHCWRGGDVVHDDDDIKRIGNSRRVRKVLL